MKEEEANIQTNWFNIKIYILFYSNIYIHNLYELIEIKLWNCVYFEIFTWFTMAIIVNIYET